MADGNPLAAAQGIELGTLYYRQGKYELAVGKFLEVLQDNPSNYAALVRLGHVYLEQRKFSDALMQFDKAAEINPQETYFYDALGFCYIELERIEEAIDKFTYVIQREPDNEHAYFGLGLCSLRRKQFDKAIGQFNKVIAINPRHAQAIYHVGVCYQHLGHSDKATDEFTLALKLNPLDGRAASSLGLVYFNHKKYAEAVREFEKALERAPEDTSFCDAFGFCYIELGRIEEAIDKFTYVIQREPDNEHAYFGLGLCSLRRKQFDKAIGQFNKVIAINPRHAQAIYHVGVCYQHLGHSDKATDEFTLALKLNPLDGRAASSLGYLSLQRKDNDAAERAFLEAVKINDKDNSAHQGLATVYLEKGVYDLAALEFKKVLACDCDNILARQMIGYLYKRDGKHEAAIAEFIKATNLYLSKDIIDRQVKNSKSNNSTALVDNKGRESVIKILRMPAFCNKEEIYSTELNTTLLPPLSLGQITAYLRSKGIAIEQDDLNIKIHYDNHYSRVPEKEIDPAPFFDENIIAQYVSGSHNEELDFIMEKVEKKTGLCGYDIILLSLPFMPSNASGLLFTLALSHYLKKKYNPILIAGGSGPAIDLLTRYNCKDINFIIFGEGEVKLFDLLSSLTQYVDSANFSCLDDMRFSRVSAAELHPPLKPDFSDLPMDKYRYIGSKLGYENGTREIVEEFNNSGTLVLPFRFIRGCPHECIFCASSRDKLMYVLDPLTVASHLKELQEQYNPSGFFFLSDTINISRHYIEELCDAIIDNKVNILWSDCARADNLDKDILRRMREAGCVRLIFGLESGSAKLLRYTNKRIGLRGLENTLKWADEAGLWTGVEIICGLPHETDNDIEETMEFLNNNKAYINTVYINQFDLREGSVLLRGAEEYGIENIREVNQYPDNNRGFISFDKYGYDEIQGLRWQDKKNQIAASYKKLIESTPWNTNFPDYEFEHFLFFLYGKLSDKRQIYDIFSRVGTEKINMRKKMIMQSRHLESNPEAAQLTLYQKNE